MVPMTIDVGRVTARIFKPISIRIPNVTAKNRHVLGAIEICERQGCVGTDEQFPRCVPPGEEV